MINTSSEFKQEIIKTGRTFATKVVINGKTYTNLEGFKITGGTNSSDVITFGDSVSSYLECTIREVPDTDHLENKIAIAYIGLQLSKSIEWIKMGTFIVSEAKRDDKDVKIHADDNMLKCTKGFFTDLKGNQSITTILNEQCKKIGITFAGGADSASVNVDKLLGMTIREVIGILASFCGKNAVMNRDGNLKFVWYDDSNLKISAESFSDPLNVNETDTLINRIRCTIDKDKEVNVGTGMGIEFSNPLMTEAQLQVIAKRVIGFKYRACDLNFMVGRPDIDAGDIIKVLDKRGNTYVVPIMDITTECDGGVWNKVKSKAKTETSKEFESKGPMTQMVERTYSELTVTKKLIAETIDAFEGNFETINTNYLNVSGKITAVEGGFEILKSDTAIFKTTVTDKLSAIDANIVTLNLQYGKIGTMDVELARINTLLAGSITSGSTQTIVLNAQNTTIANALIKSAMIDSLGANKITTGTIDASSIHFKSKTGNMDIFDNTISIRDANRVRVQIGKDASSDYNIYVWDKVGKLMFDATGLKADGIKDKIIRDDMVSDTANINGAKLNITSVVTAINNGTSNIKSSHITYDPTGQSLNVAFNSLTSKIDNMEIGGRNLSPIKTIGRYSGGNTISGDLTNLKITGYKVETTAKPSDIIGFVASNISSSKISISGFSNLATLNVYYKFNNASQLSTTVKTTNGKFTLTLNVPIGATNVSIGLGQHPFVANYYVDKVMIVNGDKPLDHVPAPEDVEDKITSLSTSLTVEQGRINALITSDTTIKGDITKVQSDYTSIKATVSGLSTTVGSHTSSIQTVTNTVTNNKANWDKAGSALTTAENAKNAIDGLEIGGRNLALGTSIPRENLRNCDYTVSSVGFEKAKYTVSFYAKSNVNGNASVYVNDDTGENKIFISFSSIALTTVYKKYTLTATASAEFAGNMNKIVIRVYGALATVLPSVKLLKLEKGNKSTDYTPAPEDIDANIKSVTDKQTAFDVTIAGITSRVSSVETNVTTAKSTADNALLKLDVETMTSDMKLFKNVCAFSGTSSAKGYLIITTPITPNRMVKLHISGYNYIEKNETIDVSIGFYNYDSSMLAHGFTNKGSFKIPTIKIAKISATDTRAVIIIGDATTSWAYAKIIVDEVIIAHNVASNAYKDGFSATVVASLPAYIQTVTVDGSDFKTEITTTKTEVAEHTVKLGQITSRVSTTESKITGIEMLNFNNFSRTGKLDGWIPVGALTLVNDSTYGKVAQITTAGDVQVTSPLFEVDANKTYKIGLTMRKADTKKGTIYFGIYCYDENKANVGSYNSSGSLNTNYYFFNTSGALASWFSVEGYLCASNIDKTQMPKGKNTTVSLAMHPKTKYITLRFLNYSHETGVASAMQYAQPFIMEGDGLIGTIDTRISSAELKITDSAIVSTVTKSSNWTSLNDKLTNTAGLLEIKDTRSTNQNPQWYFTNYPKKTVKELKLCASVGVGGEVALSTLITEISWADSSGGYPTQLLYPNNSQNIYRRVGTSNTTWGAWTKVAGLHNIVSSINQTAEAIKISASKIDLTGYVTITNLATSGKTTIDGGNIKSGTITADHISGKTLNAITITGSSITGGTITGNTTITVGTNLTVGNNIYIGTYADRTVRKSFYFNDRFMISSANDMLFFGLNDGNVYKNKIYMSSLGSINLDSSQDINIISGNQVFLQGKISITSSLSVSSSIYAQSLELKFSTPFIDFHCLNSDADYSLRLINDRADSLIIQCLDGGSLNLYSTKNYDGWFNYRANCPNGHWFDRTVSAMAWETRSSETIKANIAPFELMQNNACDIIKSAKVYEYNLKEELSKGIQQKHYGFVIERETPKVLLSSSGQGIDTYTMASINWQATKELIVSRNELIREIATLKARITQLEMHS